MSMGQCHIAKCRAELAPDSPASESEICQLLNTSNLQTASYVVVHVGSGAPARELSVDTWRRVVGSLSSKQLVVFTGRGPREKSAISEIISGLPNCIDATDRLSWQGFVTTIRYADRLYGVESMAGHVAAAVGTASVLVYSGMAGVARWRPDTDLARIWTHHVPCSPCGKMEGCEHMSCVRGVGAEDLLSSISTESRI
jgi:ADP-heptose:LPS heptosyltransferase